MHKRIMALAVTIALAVSLFAGCGSKTSEQAGTSTPSTPSAPSTTNETVAETTTVAEATAQKVTLTGMAQSSWITLGIDPMLKAIEDKTGITLEIQKLPEGAQGDQIVKTKIATNDLPDITIYQSGATFAGLDPENNFMDMSNEAWAANVYDTLKNPLSYKGKFYGAPFVGYGMNIGGVFYNKKVFADLNLEIPKTWNEFLNVCEKVKAAGKTPVYYSLKDAWTSQLFTLLSIPYVEKEVPDFADKISNNQIKFADTPSYVQGLGRAKEIKDKGYINKDYLAATYDNAQKALVNGDAAMYPMGSWIMDQLAKNYSDKINDIGAFAMPAPDGQEPMASVWAAGGVYISKNTKNADAAKKWLETYSTPEIQTVYYNVVKGFPGIKGVNATGLYPAFEELKSYMDAGKSTLVLEAKMTLPINDLAKVTQEVIVSKTPELGAKDIDAQVEKAAKQQKAPGW